MKGGWEGDTECIAQWRGSKKERVKGENGGMGGGGGAIAGLFLVV